MLIADGAVADVLMGSPAYRCGVGPSMKLVAVNGRRYSDELLRQAIQEAKENGPSVELILDNAGYFKVVKIDYHGGEKYPHLVRDANTAAILDDILKPLTNVTKQASLR
jgi:predicted metalloprotease with PDZ domain